MRYLPTLPNLQKVFKCNDPTWHGEMYAIREACKKLGSPSLGGCRLYSSALPCAMCAGAIYWSKLEAVRPIVFKVVIDLYVLEQLPPPRLLISLILPSAYPSLC